MFALRRNQIIVTTLVAMIAVAGYLNFHSEQTQTASLTELDLTDQAQAEQTALLPEDMEALENEEGEIATLPDTQPGDPVALDPLTAEVYTDPADDTGAAVLVNSDLGADTYFVQAKLDREQSRAKQKDMLTEMMNNQNLSEEQKEEAAQSMLSIQERIEKETAAEAMIEAKGFAEAYVRMDDGTVDVVVSAQELTDQQLAQIEDIVKRKTGATADQIRISTFQQQP